MRIELSDKNKQVLFGELNLGEVFRYHGDYYIKTMIIYQYMTAINLSTGTRLSFEDTIEVEIVDCVLKINS